jgi:hypothetical protein
MRSLAFAAAALIACTGAAHADSLKSIDFDGAAFTLTPGSDVGAFGLRGAWGPKWGPVYVQAEYAAFIAFYDATPGTMIHDVSSRGLVQRAGVTLRWPVASLLFDDRSGSINFWLEGGAGRVFPTWTSATNDLIAGWGMEIQFRHHDGKPGKAFWFGARLDATPLSGVSTGPAICDGPCNAPTKGAGYGVGLSILMGMSWGR